MVLGRFVGALSALILASFFPQENTFVQFIVWIFFAVIGTIIGIASSIVTGPMVKPDSNKPQPQDYEEYWIKEYGPELGPKAYQMYLEDLQRL